MADTEKAILGIESTSVLVEQLGKAFDELESHKDSSLRNKIQWEDIKEHFCNLQKSLKRKFDELEEKEKSFEEKEAESRTLLAEREATVAAKEQASLDRLQQLKDIAVSAIMEACKKYKVVSPVLDDVTGSKENKVSTSVYDPNAPIPAPEENFPDNGSGEVAEAVAVEVKPRPQLSHLCEQMDAKALLKFISDNRKNLAMLREELSIAFKSATEPARLVLNSLEGFYPPDQSNTLGNEDTALQSLRRTCLVLMESAAPILGMMEAGDDHHVSFEIKQQAKAISDEWKPKLAGLDIDACNGYSLEAQAFLQLLATFSIAREFDEDELCKLVLAVSRRRQAPELCRSLGLTHKMPGVVEALAKHGKQIDAVHFAHAFQLTESFPLVPLLKQYLDDLRSNAQKNSGNAGDVGVQELGALRAVIKCIEEYKLQEEHPLEPLQKQVAQLERAKAEKKRMAEAAKFQAKRPRASGGYAPRKPALAVDNRHLPRPVFDERGLYAGGAERYPYAAPPPAYEVPGHAMYGQQASVQRPYHYPNERAPHPTPYGASFNYGSYTNSGMQSAPNNYGNYMGTGLQSASSNYGSYMAPGHQSYM